MKVTGFSFVRNALLYDYPVVEALSSILPICDAVVVAVGQSDDGTLELVKSIHPKVRVVETVWDDSLRHGGRVLAIETDKAFRAIAPETDWAFYLQADEVVHENNLDAIQAAMRRWRDDAGVDGLLFTYRHLYGSYGYGATSPRWYRREIRIVRNDKSIFSYHDAQGFRKGRNEKQRVKPVDACIYHYGWVKNPRNMQRKRAWFSRLWHDDRWLAAHATGGNDFDYSTVDVLELFTGTHPAVMRERIARCEWTFAHDPSRNRLSLSDRAAVALERRLGVRIEERRNYVMV